MDQAYWLGRTHASSEMAKRAQGAEARMAHLELAGRYSIKAATASSRRSVQAAPGTRMVLRSSPAEVNADAVFGGVAYYERLETGARWMASNAAGAAERDRHLAAANKYARLHSDAASRRVFA